MTQEPLDLLMPAALPGYRALPAGARELLHDAVKVRRLAKNELLLREGQYCNALYFVASGMLRSWHNKDGQSINLHFALENTCTTNLQQLRSGLPSEHNIQASEASVVLVIEKDALMQLYGLSPEISEWGRAILEMLLDEQEQQARMFRLQSAKERYDFLAARHPHLLQRVSLTQLSSYLGISRETMSRIRRP